MTFSEFMWNARNITSIVIPHYAYGPAILEHLEKNWTEEELQQRVIEVQYYFGRDSIYLTINKLRELWKDYDNEQSRSAPTVE